MNRHQPAVREHDGAGAMGEDPGDVTLLDGGDPACRSRVPYPMSTETIAVGRRVVWSVRAVALLTGAMGIVNLVSAATPALADRLVLLRRLLPLEVRYGSHLAAALAGFALLLLSQSLWRRKQAASALTIVLLVASAVAHLLKGLDYEEALFATAIALWLFSLRTHFHARSDRPSVRQGVRVLALALLCTLLYGVAGFFLIDWRHFRADFNLVDATRETLTLFIEFSDPGLHPRTRFARYFVDSIYAVGAGTIGFALFSLVRPVLLRNPATDAERERARAIVEAHGRSSLARFTLFDDKSYYFSPGGTVVAFALEGRVCVALGDPIGPPEDIAAAIQGFRDFCARNDWEPAFYQTLPDYLSLYRAAGFRVLCIGNEAIVDLDAFTLSGGAAKSLRSHVNRLLRAGHKPEMLEPPLSPDIIEELRDVSDEWLTATRGAEKRFSLGWFDDDYIRECPVMVVWTPSGTIGAFANVIPEYTIPESTIDLMRRRTDIANGTMELLFVQLFQWAKEGGYKTFNLGLSPLAGVGIQTDDPAAERAIHFIYEHINQFYNFKGLYAFKSKFDPEWVPRYLIYPGAATLPAVALAVIRADNGNAFPWNRSG